MAMKTTAFEGEQTETVLAQVLANGGFDESLYVEVPAIGSERRTDGGARDYGTGSVEFTEPAATYDRGDYSHLTFEPLDYAEKHVLVRVEPATFTDPTNVDEPTFNGTDVPRICPQCGRNAAAVVKSEYDTDTGGVVADDADTCVVDPDGRGKWFGFNTERAFVHGLYYGEYVRVPETRVARRSTAVDRPEQADDV